MVTELFIFAESASQSGLPLGITSGGAWLLRNAWLIPLLPALSFLGILFFGKRMPRKGAELGIAAVGIAFVLAVLTGLAWLDHRDNYHGEETHLAVAAVEHHGEISHDEHHDDSHDEHAASGHSESGHHATHSSLAVSNTVTWFQTNGVDISVGVLVDGLSVMMLFVVTLVSLLVHIYSTDYVGGDRRYTHYFAFLSLFSASMLTLVISENTLQLLVAWELVGVCSFALIGHWWEEKQRCSTQSISYQPSRRHGPFSRSNDSVLLCRFCFTRHIRIIFNRSHKRCCKQWATFSHSATSRCHLFDGSSNVEIRAVLSPYMATGCHGRTHTSLSPYSRSNNGRCWRIHDRSTLRSVL